MESVSQIIPVEVEGQRILFLEDRMWKRHRLVFASEGSEASAEDFWVNLRRNIDGTRVTTTHGHNGLNAEESVKMAMLLNEAAKVAQRWEESDAEERERAAKAREIAEKARREAREKQEAELAKRIERCMMEFADEPVRVRAQGYKSVVRGVMRVRETFRYNRNTLTREGTGEFIPYIEYTNDADRDRPERIGSIRRLEIKVGGRFKVVWDDGRDDLPIYDRGANAHRDNETEVFEGFRDEEW